ncbi:helix-turn-helix transcriptional regulator [Solwaraspora sp. WMMD406]|uniref:helix-turn-helix domain-containing protein n=1 Tax=Solwaraspora sp. WMMD406 TaxID=3016095 RepID=UPI002416A645|nr:helix-turn-helix transcriptional regulator [Solwaraspora sp. WMMD406]MDG4763251.1 helix-turn-helix transcriptional regulator [Solwaraspora sp. WMMD406]
MSASEYLIEDLRRIRELLGLTQESWGERIHFSASHVGAVERGERPALPDYLTAVDRQYRTGFMKFYRKFVIGESAPVWLRPWLDYEREATMLRYFELAVISGVLQTEAYARAVIGTTRSGVAADDAVAARLARWGVVTREANPPRVVVILDDSALRRPVGGPAVMHEQLTVLAEAIERPNISVFIVPAYVGAYAGLDGPVALATAHGRTVGLRDAPGAGDVVEDPAAVDLLDRQWEAIREYALPQDQSLDLIMKAVDSWT